MMKLAGLRTSRIARIFATGLVLSIIIGTLVFIWTLRLQEIGKWKTDRNLQCRSGGKHFAANGFCVLGNYQYC
jgi:hypothetical protein